MKVYRLPNGVRVEPVIDHVLVALRTEGEAIPELAVYSRSQSEWIVRKLDQPIKGPVYPFVAGSLLVYRAGRYLCAFDDREQKWAIADLGEAYHDMLVGPSVQGPMGSQFGSMVFRAGRFAYAYSVEGARWETCDLEETSEGPPTISNRYTAGDHAAVTTSSNKWFCSFDVFNGKWEKISLDLGSDNDAP
jgi:hypothetical protein